MLRRLLFQEGFKLSGESVWDGGEWKVEGVTMVNEIVHAT